MRILILSVSLLLCLKTSIGEISTWDLTENICPDFYPEIWKSYVPIGNLSAGTFVEIPNSPTMKFCMEKCCANPSCNIILMHNVTCYHVSCTESKLCLPLYRPDMANMQGAPSMMLVRPVEPNVDWIDLIDANNELDMDATKQNPYMLRPKIDTCRNDQDCSDNEVCVSKRKQPGIRVCQCITGYQANSQGICISEDFDQVEQTVTSDVANTQFRKDLSTPTKPPLKQLRVSAVSKEIQLPENEATLSAYTVLGEQGNEHYNYVWTLLSQPAGQPGTMTDQNLSTVKLSNLSEGLYKFKVAVSSPTAYGEAYANVSVLAPKRINKAPIAIISPASQVVKLPNTGAVLDGSTSTDDDKVISYHWELQQGPMGYQPTLIDTPTLQLNNLIAGNYTFKLTIEDSDHATNYTTANITVLKVIDYPPSANAGQDVIIHLPQNTITLNGNLSTDDKGIVSWEWTQSRPNENKVADMQNTRTPYLELSNLDKGMYTFALKVVDESDQSSTAEVHVFVQEASNEPPIADAGENITIALPETKVTLDGSKSHDDSKILTYLWEQVSGPNKAVFSSANQSIINVTQLTKGNYVFKLTVTDKDGNKSAAIVGVEVTQNKNAAPIADAGGNKEIVEPVTILVLNGSRSSDDLRIQNWSWSRDPSSLAIGTVMEGSDKSPILMLSNIVPGRYVFTLTVTDEQGLSNQDVASVIVKPDPHLRHLVELTLNIEANLLKKSQMDSLIVQLQMLLQDEAKIIIRNLKAEPRTGKAVLIFYVEKNQGKVVVSGPEVVQKLKEKLRQDSGLLQISVTSVETAVCQNECSDHGICDQGSRQCMCDAFWMENLIQKYFGNGESNCDWSILYVIIGLLLLVVCWVGCIWGVLCLLQRICSGKRRSSRPKKKPARYSLLQPDPEDESFSYSTNNKMMLSESDTDSDDVLFESRKGKSNGHLRNGKMRNGFLSPKVKT